MFFNKTLAKNDQSERRGIILRFYKRFPDVQFDVNISEWASSRIVFKMGIMFFLILLDDQSSKIIGSGVRSRLNRQNTE